jgi:hypothetical protein
MYHPVSAKKRPQKSTECNVVIYRVQAEEKGMCWRRMENRQKIENHNTQIPCSVLNFKSGNVRSSWWTISQRVGASAAASKSPTYFDPNATFTNFTSLQTPTQCAQMRIEWWCERVKTLQAQDESTLRCNLWACPQFHILGKRIILLEPKSLSIKLG